jgi:hypothetical protein
MKVLLCNFLLPYVPWAQTFPSAQSVFVLQCSRLNSTVAGSIPDEVTGFFN